MEHLPTGSWDRMATKLDLQLLRTELKAEMDVRFAEVRVQFADLRIELHKTLRLHMLAMMAVWSLPSGSFPSPQLRVTQQRDESARTVSCTAS